MSNQILQESIQDRVSNFLKKNLKILFIILIITIIFLIIFGYYSHQKKQKDIVISDQFTYASILIKDKKINESKLLLENIIKKKHKFYSPLALNSLIDNELETDNKKIIDYFDQILAIKSINNENLNLIRIKKALFIFNGKNEELIIATLNPIINSNSVWKESAIKLIADYFSSKNEKNKAEEYYKLLNKKFEK
ncbi:MAG: putative negative regulator of RcsB-dependent stress response [Pelagibacterales bacterium]|nr:putative negative regulator of RcsB-dependent stress response [Pelagibacterales bacterium]